MIGRARPIGPLIIFGLVLAWSFSTALWAQQTQGGQGGRREKVEDFEKWLEEEVVWIISAREREHFAALQDDHARRRFIHDFWRVRDPFPATAKNEYREEHEKRLQYVRQEFQTTVPGWFGDRGRTYILHGPPSRRQKEEGREVWTYPRLGQRGLPGPLELVFEQRAIAAQSAEPKSPAGARPVGGEQSGSVYRLVDVRPAFGVEPSSSWDPKALIRAILSSPGDRLDRRRQERKLEAESLEALLFSHPRAESDFEVALQTAVFPGKAPEVLFTLTVAHEALKAPEGAAQGRSLLLTTFCGLYAWEDGRRIDSVDNRLRLPWAGFGSDGDTRPSMSHVFHGVAGPQRILCAVRNERTGRTGWAGVDINAPALRDRPLASDLVLTQRESMSLATVEHPLDVAGRRFYLPERFVFVSGDPIFAVFSVAVEGDWPEQLNFSYKLVQGGQRVFNSSIRALRRRGRSPYRYSIRLDWDVDPGEYRLYLTLIDAVGDRTLHLFRDFRIVSDSAR